MFVRFLSFIIAPFFNFPRLEWVLLMELDEIRKLLQDSLPDCQVSISGDSHSVSLKLVGELFEGMSKVKRQQRVYAVLKDLIANGDLHAVNMQTFTPTEIEQ